MKPTRPATFGKLLLAALAICAGTVVRAQGPETISTDRPDQSDGVYTVPVGVFQLENGINLAEDLLLNDLMVRYGLGKRSEARLVVDAGTVAGESGLLLVVFSVKQRLVEARGALPAIAFVGYAGIGALATGEFQEDRITTELKLAFEQDLSERFGLGYNLGTSDPFRNFNLTCGLGYSAGDRLSAFVEYFATFSQGPPQHNVDAGVLFALTPVLQVDLAGGRALFAREERTFLTAGLAYRFGVAASDKALEQ